MNSDLPSYGGRETAYIPNTEIQDVYDNAERTRTAIRDFIKNMLAYEQG